MSNNQNGSTNFLTGVIVGSIVGAATALLLAPKSGKELRSDINTQVSTIKDKSGEWKETVMEKGTEISATAKEKTAHLRQVAMETGTNVKDVVKAKAEQLKSTVKKSDNQDQSEEAVELAEVDNEVAEEINNATVSNEAEFVKQS